MWRKSTNLNSIKILWEKINTQNPAWKSDILVIIITLGSYFGLFNLEDYSFQVI